MLSHQFSAVAVHAAICLIWVTNEHALVTDNLASQHVINEKLVSISFTPTNSQDPGNGELTFGGIDPSKFQGSIHMVYVLFVLSLPERIAVLI